MDSVRTHNNHRSWRLGAISAARGKQCLDQGKETNLHSASGTQVHEYDSLRNAIKVTFQLLGTGGGRVDCTHISQAYYKIRHDFSAAASTRKP